MSVEAIPCPVCTVELPDDVADGDACESCGSVYTLPDDSDFDEDVEEDESEDDDA